MTEAYVCTIGKASPRNWPLCREIGLYGIPGHSRKPAARKGDRMFVWMGGRGYIAEAVISEDPRPPTSRAEAPWPGGVYSFGWVIAFDLLLEVEKPVWFPFVGPNQQHTGVSKSGLQRGLARLGTEGAEIIAAALREEAETERTH